jgi:flagellar assembly protein FliH
MVAAQKFLFETSFDAIEAERRSDNRRGAQPPVALTEEQLAAIRNESFAAGRAQGAEETRAAAETLAAQALARIDERLAAAVASLGTVIDSIKRDAVQAAIAVMRKLTPGFARSANLADIEAVVASCLNAVMEEPRIVVRLHDSLLDSLKERVTGLAARAGYDGKVVLIADEALRPGDCRVEWADGGAERDTEWMWSQIDGVVERFFAGLSVPAPSPATESTPPQETGAPPDAAQRLTE